MSCQSGKLPYPSPQAAAAVMLHQSKRHTTRKHAPKWAKGKEGVYHCKMCGKWHVGHKVIKDKPCK